MEGITDYGRVRIYTLRPALFFAQWHKEGCSCPPIQLGQTCPATMTSQATCVEQQPESLTDCSATCSSTGKSSPVKTAAMRLSLASLNCMSELTMN